MSATLLLSHLLDDAGGPADSGYLLVLGGEGLEDLPTEVNTARGKLQVHRASTEIGLRHLLWKAKGAPLIAVLPEPLAQKIQTAPDILRRARNRRVHALAVNDILHVLLGVRVVGADDGYMQELALDHLSALQLQVNRRTMPTVVDRRLLTELLIDASVGEQVRRQSPAELFADWLTHPPAWSDNISKLVRDALPSLHGDEGKLLAWALERPSERLEELLLRGALLTIDKAEVPQAAWGLLWRAALAEPIHMDRRIVRRTAAHLADETLETLGDDARDFLVKADRLGRQTLTPTTLQTSHVLPLAFEVRSQALAERAAKGGAIRPEEVVWLKNHHAARLHKSELRVLEAIARLSRYLALPASAAGDVGTLVSRYQQHGAFADLAVTQLRRALASSAHYHTESQTLMATVRQRRDQHNLEFAQRLASGYEAALHTKDVTPLHCIWKRVVSPTWSRDGESPLYLVVMDGCSYPVFLELLYELSQDSSFPIGIQADRAGQVVGLPALAPLPTITSHARGAIFLGALPSDPLCTEMHYRDPEQAKTDKARFKQNTELGEHSRKLFLKADLADGGGQLLSAVRDSDVHVVAVVFNAVDDQIGSSNTGAPLQLTAESITAFKPSLRAALEAGRRVLLTADHGHSPFVDKSLRVQAGSTPRYIVLGPDEEVPEGFTEIDLGPYGGPSERRAFAHASGVYRGLPQVGFHGGCGLEEMVVPLAWLSKEGLYADEPQWWYSAGAIAAPTPKPDPITPPVVTPVPSDPPPTKPQMSLFDPAEQADLLPIDSAVLATLDNDQRAALVILKKVGSARATELGAQLKKNPMRLNGLMRDLKRKLHLEGLTLFSDSVLPEGETQYLWVEPGAKS